MSAVRIPPLFRAHVGGIKQVELPAGTLGEVLDALATTHPVLRSLLFAEDGTLARGLRAFVDSRDARQTGGLSTPVGEHDLVVILPATGGGATGGGATRGGGA